MLNLKKSLILTIFMVLSANSYAVQKGDWIIRGGLTNIAPQDNTGGVVTVDDKTNLTATIAYLVTDNIGVEVLLGLPFKHNLNSGGVKVGEGTHLPPTLTAQYYFNETKAGFRPYVGVGYNYTFFLEDKITIATGGLAGGNLKIGDSNGFAYQLGFDLEISEGFGINLEIRRFNIENKARITNIVSPMEFNVALDPTTIGLSLYKEF